MMDDGRNCVCAFIADLLPSLVRCVFHSLGKVWDLFLTAEGVLANHHPSPYSSHERGILRLLTGTPDTMKVTKLRDVPFQEEVDLEMIVPLTDRRVLVETGRVESGQWARYEVLDYRRVKFGSTDMSGVRTTPLRFEGGIGADNQSMLQLADGTILTAEGSLLHVQTMHFEQGQSERTQQPRRQANL